MIALSIRSASYLGRWNELRPMIEPNPAGMDRTDLIEQLVVIENRGTAREDDDAAAGEHAINDVSDSLRRGRDRNAPLVVHLAGCIPLDMRHRQLYLDDVRPELSRDVGGIARHTSSKSLLRAVSLPLSCQGFRGCRRSRCRFIMAGAVLPLLELMHDLGDDLGWPAAGIDDDRMLVRRRLLQCRKLAVEQGHRHEVLVPRGHAPADEVVRSF